MSTEPDKPDKKKSFVSLPFIIIGLGLLGMILPVFPDIDQVGEADPSKRKRDSISKYVLYRVMASQEKDKAKATATSVENGTINGPSPTKLPGIKLNKDGKKTGQRSRPKLDDE